MSISALSSAAATLTLTNVLLILSLGRQTGLPRVWALLTVLLAGCSVLLRGPIGPLFLALSSLALYASGSTILRSRLALALTAGMIVLLVLAGVSGWTGPVFRWYAASVTTLGAIVATPALVWRRRGDQPVQAAGVLAVLALAVAPYPGLLLGEEPTQWIVCIFLAAFGALQIGSVRATDQERPRVLQFETSERELKIQEDLVSLGLLAATAAHELKNGIANLRLVAHHGLAANTLEGKDQALEAIAEVVDGSSSVLASLLDEVAVRESERAQAVAVAEIVRQATRVARCSVPGTRVAASVPESLRVVCHPSQMRHVLAGLLRNAATAYGESPGIIQLTATTVGTDLAIDISDKAGGLALEARMSRLNDPTPPGRGGLGLSLITRILERNGGRLEYGSLPGGSLFRVVIPLQVDTGQTRLL